MYFCRRSAFAAWVWADSAERLQRQNNKDECLCAVHLSSQWALCAILETHDARPAHPDSAIMELQTLHTPSLPPSLSLTHAHTHTKELRAFSASQLQPSHHLQWRSYHLPFCSPALSLSLCVWHTQWAFTPQVCIWVRVTFQMFSETRRRW